MFRIRLYCSIVLLFSTFFVYNTIASVGVEAQENIDAATILYQKGITKVLPEKTAFYENLTRKDAAILLKRFASNILHKSADTSACVYNDIATISSTNDQSEIIEACNLGLFKPGNFHADDYFTRGQLVTVVARMIANDPKIEKNSAYDYLLHLGIVKVDDRLDDTKMAPRKDVYIMLQRIIVSLSQIAAYSPYADAFSVGNTASNTSQGTLESQDGATKVYKVMVYRKNKIYGNYELLQLGSSVVIAPGTLITNAHVIYDDSEEETYQNIEICTMNQKDNKVECITTATVSYYDKDKDLALLKVADPSKLAKPVQLASQAPHNGDVVNVRGYPSIGGQSITFTKGIISGIERDKYKSDVKIDHGNSGGGAFNKKGELVGIPNSAEVDTDTLSYIIPYETVKSFLARKGDILVNTGSSESSFSTYIQELQIAKNTRTIKNPIFSLDNINGYVLDDYSFDSSRNLHSLSISTQDSNLAISISNDVRTGSGNTREDRNKKLTEQFKKCETSSTGDIQFQGRNWEFGICSKYYGGTNNIAFISYMDGNYPIGISFYSKNAITQKIVENTLRKVTLGNISMPVSFDLYTMGPVTLAATPDTNLVYTLGDGGSIDTNLTISHGSTTAQGTISIVEVNKARFDIQSKGKSYLEMLQDNTDFYTDPSYFTILLSGGLYKNSIGSTFFILANSSKKEDLDKNEEPRRTISILSYGKKNDNIYYFAIDFTYKGNQDTALENQIIHYIDTIKVDGVLPITDVGGSVKEVTSISLLQ